MEHITGAIKVEQNPADSYQKAGRRLTEEAARTMTGHCACCGTNEGTLYLWHLSVQSGDTISTGICHKCAKKTSVYDLLVITLEKLIHDEEIKRNNSGMNCN